MIRVGVIGYGYWGPVVARNFQCHRRLPAGRRLRRESRRRRTAPGKLIPASLVTGDACGDRPLARHRRRRRRHARLDPLRVGQSGARKRQARLRREAVHRHVGAGDELIDLAAAKNLQIMVDHTFLFTGAVRKIRQLIDEGVLGKLYYYDSTRVNLGLFQHDVNVIWDLAPHDLVDHGLPDRAPSRKPSSPPAQCHLNGLEDMAYITVYFPTTCIAHINVNWLSPVKVRTTLIGGEKKMLVWNDLEADEKIKVYDKGVEITNGEGVYDLLVSYRSGDMWAPKVEQTEALKLEAKYFVDCIDEERDPVQRRPWPACAWSACSRPPTQSLKDRGRPVDAMSDYLCIAPDVKLGKNVKLSKFINLYGCEIGDNTKIGAFVEIQKNASIGRNCKISSHTFICEGVTIEDNVFIGHGVTFINDTYPRATAPDGESADRSRTGRSRPR